MENNNTNTTTENTSTETNTNNETKSNDTNQNEKKTPADIPYDVFKKKNEEVNTLKTQLAELTENLESLKTGSETSKTEFENKLKEITESNNEIIKGYTEKIQNNLLDQAGVEDKKYLNFLINEKITETKDTDNSLDFESALNAVKETNPNLFVENRKAPGNKPNSNDGKMSMEQYNNLSKDERKAARDSGIINFN